MSYSKNWAFVDHFAIFQAAWLWCGEEPKPYLGKILFSTQNRPGEVTAIFQMLCSAVRAGGLPADHTANSNYYSELHPIPKDLGESSISREDLVAFAKSKNQFPAFLFDTMAPEPEQTKTGVVQPSTKFETPEVKNKGGRPIEHDWDGARIEILRIADEDGLPKKRADLVRAVLSWFSETYGKEPVESEVKRLVSPIYAALEARGWKPNG